MKKVYANIVLLFTIKSCLCANPDDIEFVHIGRTGGSTSRVNFARTFDQSSLNIGYVHENKPNVQKYNKFFITIRNPIDRMVSWFISQHPTNKRYVRQHTQLYDCFHGINDLVTYGLERGDVDYIDLDDCQILARYLMRGIGSQSHENVHILQNYNYYTSELLSHPEKKIYVIRREHLMDDWVAAAEDVIIKSNIRVNLSMADNGVPKRKNQVVIKKEMSQEGLANACFFLCPEIQLYKKILKRAINLSDRDESSSLEDLAKSCPLEARSDYCEIGY